MKKLGKSTTTSRGFPIVKFEDSNGEKCSLQASSRALQHPGTAAVWLGIDVVNAQVRHDHASKVGIKTDAKVGWLPYPIPEEVLVSTRMHLTREQVEALVNHLTAWLKSDCGQFEFPDYSAN